MTDRTFELYDKGVKIIDSIDRYSQVRAAWKWIGLAEDEMRQSWWWELRIRLGAKDRMFKVA